MSDTFLGAHDPRDVELLIAGISVENSFGEGNIEISRTENVNTPMVGFQGDIHIEHGMNKTGTLTVPIKAGSDWDTALSELQGLSDVSENGLPYFPVFYRNKSTNKFISTVGWIESQPDIAEGAERADRPYVLGLANCVPSAVSQANSLVSQFQAWAG